MPYSCSDIFGVIDTHKTGHINAEELFTFITAFFDNKEGAAASIEACPKIKNSVALIKNLPAMREHLAKRAAKAP